MKNLIAIFLLFNAAATFAQVKAPESLLPKSQVPKPVLQSNTDPGKAADSLYRHLPDAKEGQPLYIVNSNIISGLGHINPNDISSLTVLKDKDVPVNLLNLSRFGVVLVTLKKGVKFEASTFGDIKKRFNIEDKVRFAVDGYFVDDENMLVSVQDINEISVTWKKNNDLSSQTTINIWLLVPEARKGIIYAPVPGDKPGTIRIRGSATR